MPEKWKLKGKYYQLSCTKMLHLKDIRQTKVFPLLHFACSPGPRASTSSSDPLKCVTRYSISEGHIFKKEISRKSGVQSFIDVTPCTKEGKVTVNGVIRVSKYHILQMYFLTSFSPNPQITIILLVKVLFQGEIMNNNFSV